MPASAYSAALTAIEMSLKYRGSVWVRGPEDATGIVLCGVDSGQPFSVVVHGMIGTPSRDLMAVLSAWRKAGASTGLAYTVGDALSIVAGSASHAS